MHGEYLLPGPQTAVFVQDSHMEKRARELSWAFFYKGTNPMAGVGGGGRGGGTAFMT